MNDCGCPSIGSCNEMIVPSVVCKDETWKAAGARQDIVQGKRDEFLKQV